MDTATESTPAAAKPRLPWQSMIVMLPLVVFTAAFLIIITPALRQLCIDSVAYIRQEPFGLATFKGVLVMLCGCIAAAVLIFWACAPLSLLRRKPSGLLHGFSVLVYMECTALALRWIPGHTLSVARQIQMIVTVLVFCGLLLMPRLRPYYGIAQWPTLRLLGRGTALGLVLTVLFYGSTLALALLARWLKS
jgi:hypothetical protein